MLVNISDIKELTPVFDIGFKTLTIVLDTTYGADSVGIHHIFGEERVLVDSVRFYNQIWSIRQNLNLYLANLVSDTTAFTASWGDIYYPFKVSKKIRNKNYVCDNVPFIDKLMSANYDFMLSFDDTVCVYEPTLNFIFQVPLEFGKPSDADYKIFDDYFMSFICFWHVYTSQALMVAFNHNIFKTLKPKVTTFKYKLNLTMSLDSKDKRNVIIQPFDMDQVVYLLTVNRMYQKFFVG